MTVLAFVILLLYNLLIISFIIGFDQVAKFTIAKEYQHINKFTLIVAFRNEAKNLPALLKSLEDLEYPKDYFEILLVNDASTDNSVELIEAFKKLHPSLDLKILENHRKTNAPKKDAITLAVSKANFDWLITTDADCEAPKKWLQAYDAYIQKNKPEMMVAPVIYRVKNTFLEQFQLLDLLSLQGATIGGFGIGKPFLCNGANLAYSKQLFKAVNGFKGNSHIASGDDVFLLEKALIKNPSKVHYLKSRDALVITQPQDDLSSLCSQRIRWAAKAKSLKKSFSKMVGLSVFTMNLLLIILLISSFLGAFNWMHLLVVFILKSAFDLYLIFKTAYFFQSNKPLLTSILSCFMYPFFTVFVALASFNHGYQWKGRTFKK